MSHEGNGLRDFKHRLAEMTPTELEELIGLLKEYREVYGKKRETLTRDFFVSLVHGASSPRIRGYTSLLQVLDEQGREKLEKAKEAGLLNVNGNSSHVNASHGFTQFRIWAHGPMNHIGISSELASKLPKVTLVLFITGGLGIGEALAGMGLGIGKALAGMALVAAAAGGILLARFFADRHPPTNILNRSLHGRPSDNGPPPEPKSAEQPDLSASPLDQSTNVEDESVPNIDLSPALAEKQGVISMHSAKREREELTIKPRSTSVPPVDSAGIKGPRSAGPEASVMNSEAKSGESAGGAELKSMAPPVGAKPPEALGSAAVVPLQVAGAREATSPQGTASTAPKPKIVPAILVKKDKISSGDDPHLPDEFKSQHRCEVLTANYKVCIAQNGYISSVDVAQQSIPEVDSRIMATVRGWRYKPQVIPICFIQFFEFYIEGNGNDCDGQYWDRPVSIDQLQSLPKHAVKNCELTMQQSLKELPANVRDLTGQIRLRVEVGPKGKVHSVKVTQGLHPDADHMVTELLRSNPSCGFEPAISKDGRRAAFVVEPYVVEFVREGTSSKVKIGP